MAARRFRFTGAALPTVTPDEIEAAGSALFGPQWQRPLAGDLPIAVRTLQRWGKAEYAPPDWVRAALLDVLDAEIAAARARLGARRAQMARRPQLAGVVADLAAGLALIERARDRIAAGAGSENSC